MSAFFMDTEAPGAFLEYEPLSMAHLEGLSQMWADPAVIRWTNVKSPCSPMESRMRLETLLENQQEAPFPTMHTILVDGQVRGLVGCPGVSWPDQIFGLFYQLQRSVWGQGIGEKSAAWQLAYMKKHYPGGQLLADVVSANLASIRILERLGFSPAGRRIHAFQHCGTVMDILDFQLQL